jgi:hypothetical protein
MKDVKKEDENKDNRKKANKDRARNEWGHMAKRNKE